MMSGTTIANSTSSSEEPPYYDHNNNDDDDNSKRRRRPISPRSIALTIHNTNCYNNPTTKYVLRWSILLLVVFGLMIAVVGIIAHLLPNRVLKANALYADVEKRKDYDCLGWHTTNGWYPLAIPRMWRFLRHFVFRRASLPCTTKIPPDDTGYCELRHKKTGRTIQLLHPTFEGGFLSHRRIKSNNKSNNVGGGETTTTTRRPDPVFACIMTHQLMEFHALLKTNPPPPPRVPLQFLDDDNNDNPQNSVSEGQQQGQQQRRRGILIYLQPQKQTDELVSVYAIVRLLRQEHHCTLPVEVWVHGGEDDVRGRRSLFEDPLWFQLLGLSGVSYQLHWDHHYQKESTIPYAMAYTSFEEVLVLSPTNFPLQDPTFLFDLPHYQSTGALFWKDLFSPQVPHETTLKELVWELLDIPVDSPLRREMEMDHGQMVVHRSKSKVQLQLLLFMSRDPWWKLLETFQVMQGTKDLYRFAWHFSPSSSSSSSSSNHNQNHEQQQLPFTFVETPPALLVAEANTNNKEEEDCTQTILQHSPQQQQAGDDTPLFVHFRGNFTSHFVVPTQQQQQNDNNKRTRRRLWDRGEYFQGGRNKDQQQYALGSYWSTEADLDPDDPNPQRLLQPCYYVKTPKLFERRSLPSNVAQLESQIRKYVQEALAIREKKTK